MPSKIHYHERFPIHSCRRRRPPLEGNGNPSSEHHTKETAQQLHPSITGSQRWLIKNAQEQNERTRPRVKSEKPNITRLIKNVNHVRRGIYGTANFESQEPPLLTFKQSRVHQKKWMQKGVEDIQSSIVDLEKQVSIPSVYVTNQPMVEGFAKTSEFGIGGTKTAGSQEAAHARSNRTSWPGENDS